MAAIDESPHRNDSSSGALVEGADAVAGDIDVEARQLLENNNARSTGAGPESAAASDAKTGKDDKSEQDRLMTDDINKLLLEMPLTKDTTCGFWIFKGAFFQKFANQVTYVIIFGLVGFLSAMTDAYFNGTITTIEKRFKIPSRNTGIITVGVDVSVIMVSGVLSYYAANSHRPRWIGFGTFIIVVFCVMNAAPHFLFGPGEDALMLTSEFGGISDENATMTMIEEQRSKTLCKLGSAGVECDADEGNLSAQIIMFTAQFISGIGGSLHHTLGISYMDDNTKKSRTPMLLSFSFFLRMLGPAVGYALASLCLRIYISPQLHSTINDKDPRWMGAWWLGWLLLGGMTFIAGIFLTMFPKDMPRSVARRIVEENRRKQVASIKDNSEMELLDEKLVLHEQPVEETKASFKDMLKTLKRLLSNKTLTYNNFSSVFYLFGYTPYWIFTPKYIEIQYRQSAATSSMVTGTVAFVFSAIGVLMAGFIISRYKPSARYMAAWNVIVGFLTVAGIMAYAFIGCPGNESSVIVNIHDSSLSSEPTCNSACNCDYVRYSPVCGENSMTYISPCHAGCKKQHIDSKNKKVFYDCSCIPSGNQSSDFNLNFDNLTATVLQTYDFEVKNVTFWNNSTLAEMSTALPTSSAHPNVLFGGKAIPDACPVNCYAQFVTFLAVMCGIKFFGATGRASNFLVAVRCVPEKDKTVSMGLSMMMMAMMAFIPGPIFFGWLLDSLCLVWGKTCSNNGNCWLYDPKSLRYILSFTASVFITIGTLFDCGVWYYVKDVKIFDEEVNEVELDIVKLGNEVNSRKKAEL